MGYQTPNMDRIAKEGMMFTDSYGEQSCTAGRSSFITGQSVYRTGDYLIQAHLCNAYVGGDGLSKSLCNPRYTPDAISPPRMGATQ